MCVSKALKSFQRIGEESGGKVGTIFQLKENRCETLAQSP